MLLLAQAAVLATTIKRNGGPVTAMRSATADDYVSVTEGGYAAVPGMTVMMPVPQGENAHLVITFSAQTGCVDNDGDSAYCHVRVLVDGQPAAPGEATFDMPNVPGGGYETNSMQFVSGPLGPGEHTVKVQYRIDEDGSFVLWARTLTVLRSRT